ncbi:hypothetical protein [Nonomuraea dietziae]|uniref:hypothetical protein n=1 Tax=Nonomuraea dietziae TaxID=65515 RepID=UPI0033F62E45
MDLLHLDEGRAWYGPDLSRVDWGAVVPVAGVLLVCVAIALWAAWPEDSPAAQAVPASSTSTPDVDTDERPSPSPSGTPLFLTLAPTYTDLLGKTPAPTDPFGALKPTPTPSKSRKGDKGEHTKQRHESRLPVEPNRPRAHELAAGGGVKRDAELTGIRRLVTGSPIVANAALSRSCIRLH